MPSSHAHPGAPLNDPLAREEPAHRDWSAGTGSFWDGLGDYWGLVLAYGLLTTVLGIVLAVWPEQTLVVCAVVVAIQVLASGILRLIAALAGSSAEGGLRALVGLSGALAIIVGLLFLRDPVQTLLVVTMLLGVWWIVGGIVDVLGAIIRGAPGRRMWDILAGVVTVLAGAVLLINPTLSLGVLVVVSCIWLIVVGIIAIVTAIRLRAAAKAREEALERAEEAAEGATG